MLRTAADERGAKFETLLISIRAEKGAIEKQLTDEAARAAQVIAIGYPRGRPGGALMPLL